MLKALDDASSTKSILRDQTSQQNNNKILCKKMVKYLKTARTFQSTNSRLSSGRMATSKGEQ